MKQLVSRQEWVGTTAFAVIVVAVTFIPYWVGYTAQPPDQQYSWFVIGADDSYSYIAKMRHGVDGYWNFFVSYTGEPHDGAPLVYLQYISLGQFARLFTNNSDPNLYQTLVMLYHTARVLFSIVLILVMYRFIAAFIDTTAQRFLTLVLAVLGGGLGILVLGVNAVPPEWFIPESFSFLILLSLPHLALARAALVGGFLMLFASKERRVWAWGAGLLWLITGVIVPFYLVVVYAVLGICGLLLWAKNRAFPMNLLTRCLIAGGVTLPLFIYFLAVFTFNPVLAQWGAQNVLPAPPPLHYLLAYGPYLLAGAFAVRAVWRSDDERYMLLLAWALVGLLMVYLPISVQRRLAEGVIIPLALLAVMGIGGQSTDNGKRRQWAAIALMLTTLPTMMFFLLGVTLEVRGAPPTLSTSRGLVSALLWLDENAIETEQGAVVMSTKLVGNRIPAYTSLRPYIGHGPETLNSGEKEPLADAFFGGEWQPQQHIDFLSDPGNYIDYVLFTPQDIVPDIIVTELELIYYEGESEVVIFENTLR